MAYTSINGPDVVVPGTLSVGRIAILAGTASGGLVYVKDVDGTIANAKTHGTKALGNAVSTGSITGLALPFIPSTVLLSMGRPSAGLYLVPAVIQTTITADGFNFELSAATDSVDYVLNFMCLP